MSHSTSPASTRKTTPKPSGTPSLVAPPLQQILPASRTGSKANQPFQQRLANVRTGDPDAKLLLLVYGGWCDVYVDGAAGRCWPGRDLARELSELGHLRFRRAHRRLRDMGAITINRRGQGRTNMLTLHAVPAPVLVQNGYPGTPSQKSQNGYPGTPSRRGTRVPDDLPVPSKDQDQQQQHAANLGRLPLQPVDAADPEPVVHLAKPPSARQLRGLDDMAAELRAADLEPAGPDRPVTRSQASEVFRLRRAQVRALRDPERLRAIRRGGGR